jgi:hypothetical protein
MGLDDARLVAGVERAMQSHQVRSVLRATWHRPKVHEHETASGYAGFHRQPCCWYLWLRVEVDRTFIHSELSDHPCFESLQWSPAVVESMTFETDRIEIWVEHQVWPAKP